MLASHLFGSAFACFTLVSALVAPSTLAQDSQHEIKDVAAGGFAAHNVAQRWSLEFDGRGVQVTPEQGGWSWGLEFVSYGFGERQTEVDSVVGMHAEEGRLTYEWDDNCDEWYVNDARGLEHGFTLRNRPERAATDGDSPLSFSVRVSGGLTPVVRESASAIYFQNKHGRETVTYSGLTVFDADGRTVPSRFELEASGFRLLVEESAARYPLTIDPVAQQVFIKASNAELGDWFGRSIAVSGDTMVAGAPFEDSSASGVDGAQNDNGLLNSGAAYVFTRSGESWVQEAYLKASSPGGSDQFGGAVAISGDTLVVGAEFEDTNSQRSGAAYVFVRNGSTWSEQAFLKASNPSADDFFGFSVAISGDTIVVGAPAEDGGSTGLNTNPRWFGSELDAGAAYVFVRSGTTWNQQALLRGTSADISGNGIPEEDRFGSAVAVSGETILVGAPGDNSPAVGINGDQDGTGSPDAGAAYIFERTGTSWNQQAYLKPSNTRLNNLFGESISISAGTAVIGMRGGDSNATGVDGDDSNLAAPVSGAAFVFLRTGTAWSQEAYLKASNTQGQDEFGRSVSVSGDRIAVGAAYEDGGSYGIDGDQFDEGGPLSGAVYLFARTNGTWSQEVYLKASNSTASQLFGWSCSVSGDTLGVGSPRDSSDGTGVGASQTLGTTWESGAIYGFDLNAAPRVFVGADFCNGDGGDQAGCTDCPCGNNTLPGTVGGCLNSAASSARLLATGSVSVSLLPLDSSDLRFELTGAPSNAFCILNSGDGVAPGSMANPCFALGSGVQAVQFDGLRCAIMNTRRHGGRSADSNGAVGSTNAPWGGEAGPPVGIAVAGGGFAAGQTRYFQVVNREDSMLSCMRGLNTSQAVEITFQP